MLVYKGEKFLPGIPARDLDDREVEQHGGYDQLIATGIYGKLVVAEPESDVFEALPPIEEDEYDLVTKPKYSRPKSGKE